MKSLKDIWYSDEYKQLREQYSDRLCFICFGGSYAYGTNIENSDIDIRGVMLPTIDELIGLKKFYQKEDSQSDTVFYEFNKFVKLCMENNPNILEMLHCREYIIFNDIGKKLLDIADMFLSKRSYITFNGYAVSQLRRVENYLAQTEYTQAEKNKHIKQTMDVAIDKLSQSNELFASGAFKVNLLDDNIYIDCDIKNARIDLVRASFNDLLTIEKTYNKLGQRNNKKDAAHLCKHIMHLFRLILMCCDILKEHTFETYREHDREYLLSIRNGRYLVNNELTQDFTTDLNSLQARMEQYNKESTLRDKCDFNAINDFVTDCNSKIINNTVIKYKEPLYQVNL